VLPSNASLLPTVQRNGFHHDQKYERRQVGQLEVLVEQRDVTPTLLLY